jgi:hypothetical protein
LFGFFSPRLVPAALLPHPGGGGGGGGPEPPKPPLGTPLQKLPDSQKIHLLFRFWFMIPKAGKFRWYALWQTGSAKRKFRWYALWQTGSAKQKNILLISFVLSYRFESRRRLKLNLCLEREPGILSGINCSTVTGEGWQRPAEDGSRQLRLWSRTG